jgi:integrase
MLTGCRRQEVAGVQWNEFDLERGTWDIPAARAKNGRGHSLTLPPLALSIIRAVPHSIGRNLLFGDRGENGFTRWSACKRELDTRSGVRGWVVHDLRRSFCTRLADLGVMPHVIEAAVNHQSGHKRGPAGVYNRSIYRAEVAAALALWNDHVRTLVEGGEHTILPMGQVQ